MKNFTSGNPKTFWMVEARYHYAAKFNTAAEANAYAVALNTTHKDRYGNDAYRVIPYDTHRGTTR